VKWQNVWRTIESHTGGNPTRTILSGIPPVPGATMLEKMRHLERHQDEIRQVLMYEPRGHGVMSGAVVLPPTDPAADLGVVYIEVGGYLPMCGHDTIGVVTALVETGQLPATEPLTELALDTPAGLVRVAARVSGGRVRWVRFTNVPAFVLHRDVELDVPGVGRVTMDIAWGGNFYGLVEAAAVGVDLTPAGAGRGIRVAQAIRAAHARHGPEVKHPLLPGVEGLTHIEFYGPPMGPEADVRNMVVVPPGGVDRSPCGTGTAAKAAVLVSRGQLALGGSFRHQSVTGAVFTATALQAVAVGGLDGLVVTVQGSAMVYGESTFVREVDDALVGFLVP
jgi:proline racemase